ncbi:polygalacturonase-like [Neltuma alba]|uniref:polygalacturonase-like n=1 Tax=Neltuma alba TaxID=207710 RepID=UPI0010A3C3C0|nr:polygalacturonase-like [Prosopis alba]
MDANFSIIYIYALFLLLASSIMAQPVVFDIRKYGGAPNGDLTSSLARAWKTACASTSASKILVPKSTYSLRQIELNGPCKAPIELHIEGNIAAPENPNQFDGDAQWIRFGYIDSLTLSGGATFDGRGSIAWKQNNCHQTWNCKKLSMNFGFSFMNNSIIQDITSKHSKHFHVNVLGCRNITFNKFTIEAPAESPNTDGIHIGRSTQVKILDSNIGTGDDCISLGDGSRQVSVENVTCGPGHGISVGSLGRYENEEPVEGLIVKNCTFKNTDNGVRIKTWPGTSIKIPVSQLRFENLVMINVTNPIIIDQEYCPWNQCSKQTPSKVQISRVSFKDIRGTSATKEGMILICSSGVPCEKVKLTNINLKFNGTPVIATCKNIKPQVFGNVPVCTS